MKKITGYMVAKKTFLGRWKSVVFTSKKIAIDFAREKKADLIRLVKLNEATGKIVEYGKEIPF